MDSALPDVDDGSTRARSRYEFRVWGRRDETCDVLSRLADEERVESHEDWYLLLGQRSCNAKIRRNRLKVKRLIEERFGFQRWAAVRHRMASGDVCPLELLMDELRLDDPNQGCPPDFEAPAGRATPGGAVPALHVTKWRRRFDLGSIRAEATEVEIEGHSGRLRTVAIEGHELDELIRLRASLGLDRSPNLAFHLAISSLVLGRVVG
jgi:hypothetical protein